MNSWSVNNLLDHAGKLIDKATGILGNLPTDHEIAVANAYISAADALARMAQARVAC